MYLWLVSATLVGNWCMSVRAHVLHPRAKKQAAGWTPVETTNPMAAARS
jgi:hypothetical protein